MTDYTELKRLAEAAPGGPWIAENDSLYFKDDGYTRHLLDADAGHDVEDEAYYAALNFIAAANPTEVRALIAENEALRQALQAITTQVDGNIRPTIRDCVNGQSNIQDVYSYCDQIGLIAAAAMKEPQP
jgi:hypothetical protein